MPMLRPLLWLVWVVAAGIITWPYFAWEVRYFQSPGAEFYRLLLILLPLFFAALGLWLWFRRRGLWRYEPAAIAGLLLAVLLFYHFAATLVTILVITACHAIGHAVCERLRLEVPSPIGDISICCALGFAVLGPILFLLGLAHLYFAWVFVLLLAAPCLLLWRHARALFLAVASLWRTWRSSDEMRDPMAGVAVVFLGLAAGASAVIIIAPSIAFDPIHTHLLSAAYYASHHLLAPVPQLPYSYYPQAAETLMTIGFSLAGQPAAQMLPPVFFALTALLALDLALQAGASRAAALVGLAAAVVVPALHWTGSVPKNDLMMAFFELAALECFLAWRRTGRFLWIPCGALMLASAFDVKHVALFAAPPLVAFFLFAIWKQPRRLAAALCVLATFLLFGLYWHARAFLDTGNPIYPSAPNQGSSSMVHAHQFVLHSLLPNPLLRYADIVRLVQFHGASLFESPLQMPLAAFVFVCWPVWFLTSARKWPPALKVALLFSGAYFAWWGASYPILRYALAPILIVFLLTGSRVADFARTASPLIRLSARLAVAYSLTLSLLGIAIIEINGPQLRLLAGRIDDAEYLQEANITTAVNRYLSRAASPGDRALFVDIGRDLYSPQFLIIQSFFHQRGKMPSEFPTVLQTWDYQWLVVMRPDLPSTLSLIAGVKSLAPVWQDPNFAVFRVSPGKI